MSKGVKAGLMPLRADLPSYVHDELNMLPGSKKMNVERLMVIWAKKEIKQREKEIKQREKEIKQREKDEARLNKGVGYE